MEDNYTLTDQFSGPAVAAVLTVEMILALIANGVVLSITLYQRKSLKQPSTVFFTSLILAHLVLNLLYLPFYIISLSAGEWIFNGSDEEKRGTCYFALYIFWWMVLVISTTLAAISFDRFLFIVKPHLHNRYMKPWVALTLTIAIWILSAVYTTFYIFGFQFDHHQFDSQYCSLPSSSSRGFFGLFAALIILGIIFVFSIWTFCFTRRFFRDQSVIAGESAYASKKKRLFGIFGSMLLIYGICLVPAVVYSLLYLFIDVPIWFIIIGTISFLFFTIANPVIQSYFRPEIMGVLVSCCPLNLYACC
ncbi:PREDICTED: high-affinity lysophosphatidic acid receptor-like [Amphimedon queenslandica]|uniref:G-protein coupled receptors family 1 profile domain-containing protein n=1 Tax=Amphimedon queenslandica TaxID=400682 RepID=A0AAN0J0N7_AMPQE|nr:PREDICTED: high-affinity lysophosphatidic acid receptor-like [Amphimedon queenslandica]|eukprot:XP_019850307.1 PREDICTED: high-affinity lysophosphatidic acid receptor-like [Amphimedon queenslandica]